MKALPSHLTPLGSKWEELGGGVDRRYEYLQCSGMTTTKHQLIHKSITLMSALNNIPDE